jgi:hypothetical protein
MDGGWLRKIIVIELDGIIKNKDQYDQQEQDQHKGIEAV